VVNCNGLGRWRPANHFNVYAPQFIRPSAEYGPGPLQQRGQPLSLLNNGSATAIARQSDRRLSRSACGGLQKFRPKARLPNLKRWFDKSMARRPACEARLSARAPPQPASTRRAAQILSARPPVVPTFFLLRLGDSALRLTRQSLTPPRIRDTSPNTEGNDTLALSPISPQLTRFEGWLTPSPSIDRARRSTSCTRTEAEC